MPLGRPMRKFGASRGPARDMIWSLVWTMRCEHRDQFSPFGQPQARARLKNLAAEYSLQALDLSADCRLSNAEVFGGLGEAAQIDDCDERSDNFGWDIFFEVPAMHRQSSDRLIAHAAVSRRARCLDALTVGCRQAHRGLNQYLQLATWQRIQIQLDPFGFGDEGRIVHGADKGRPPGR